jgi:hypothetical protein
MEENEKFATKEKIIQLVNALSDDYVERVYCYIKGLIDSKEISKKGA